MKVGKVSMYGNKKFPEYNVKWLKQVQNSVEYPHMCVCLRQMGEMYMFAYM